LDFSYAKLYFGQEIIKLKVITPLKKERNYSPNSKGKAVQYAGNDEHIGVGSLVSRKAAHTGIGAPKKQLCKKKKPEGKVLATP